MALQFGEFQGSPDMQTASIMLRPQAPKVYKTRGSPQQHSHPSGTTESQHQLQQYSILNTFY
jgi:hypothetical protein